ncbi:MAG: phage tail assembly chaperone [Methylococcaceae bacterium]|nr:phage tail assembly chaperone [Methylococcaceae bacterium]
MSNDTLKGTSPSVRPVSLETLEKRVRRALAPRACSLLKTRPGTPDRYELGLYAVLDHKRVCIEKNANIEALARYLGALDDNEAIADTVPEKWLPVTIRVVNEQAVTVGHRFIVKAKHTDKITGAILRDGTVELWRNVDHARCAEILMKLLTNWRNVFDSDGEPMEFNLENLMLMLQAYPHSGKAISDALLDEIAKGGTKNGSL